MSEQINNGKLEVMGINIDISQVLGQKIVDQYIAQISEEQMKTIMDYISKDLFSKESVYNYELEKRVEKLKITEREKDRWGSYTSKEVPIGELIKNHFNSRINEELKKKVEEIIATDDYKQKIEEIANELIDYSINGYKEDMKNRIRERLVGNVMDTMSSYGGVNLMHIINDAIDQRLRQY